MDGFGIDVKDPNKIGDEDDARIVGHDITDGNEEGGRTAMENLLQKSPDINVVYTINEPAAAGAYEALKAVGKEKDVLIVSVDGGCPGVEERQGRRHRRDLAAVSAADGLDGHRGDQEVRRRPARSRSRPKARTSSTPASTLVTDKPVDGVEFDRHQGQGPRALLGLMTVRLDRQIRC